MNESKFIYKPNTQSQLMTKFILSQCNIHASFKQPSGLSSALLLLVYIQCLKYNVDLYWKLWFDAPFNVFALVDLSYYLDRLPSYVLATVALAYVVWSVGVGAGVICGKRVFVVAKVLQMLFGTVLFKPIISSNSLSLHNYIYPQTQAPLSLTLSLLSLALFPLTITLQTLTRYQFLQTATQISAIRTSNWSPVTLLLYILVNEVTWQSSNYLRTAHFIVRDTCFVLHLLVFVTKQEAEGFEMRVEGVGVAVNGIAVVLGLCMVLFSVRLGIGFLAVLSVLAIISISTLQTFSLSSQLQNIHKWSTSQQIISYTSTLRKLLRLKSTENNCKILFIGYIEIHEQKCDNEQCPLKSTTMKDQEFQSHRFQDLIRDIYNDGYHMSPVSNQLLLEFGAFWDQVGSREKALRILLQVNEQELPIDQLYKLMRLKNKIKSQICQEPNQRFLDLISQLQIQHLQERILRRFEESALISLQFWSILNEDHPDFQKLHKTGKCRTETLSEIESIYQEIKAIAYSQKITTLFINYLNCIANEEMMFSEIEDLFKKQEGFDDKIVIENWASNFLPVLVVSLEEDNYGVVIDINTACATLFHHQKFSFIGKHIKTLFSDALSSQVQQFMDFNTSETHQFYTNFNSTFSMQISRKVKLFSSINTGLCLIMTIQHKFQPNTCFLIFNSSSSSSTSSSSSPSSSSPSPSPSSSSSPSPSSSSSISKLVSMSTSSIALLGLEKHIFESECLYGDLFAINMDDFYQERKNLALNAVFLEERVRHMLEKDSMAKEIYNRVFNIKKTRKNNFSILTFRYLKKSRKINTAILSRTQQSMQLSLSIVSDIPTQAQLYRVLPPILFSFNPTIVSNEQFSYESSRKQSHPSKNRSSFLVFGDQHEQQGDGRARLWRDPANDKQRKDGITTLRLCQGFLRVLEEEASEESMEKEYLNLIADIKEAGQNLQEISKVDEQKIFKSRNSYHNFIQNNTKRFYVGYTIIISTVLCIGMYIGEYFHLKFNYELHESLYFRYQLGIQINGKFSEMSAIVNLARYMSYLPVDEEILRIVLINSKQGLQKVQQLMTDYYNPIPIEIYIDRDKKQQLYSDEYYNSFIAEYSKVYDRFLEFGFVNYTGDDPSSIFVDFNGNLSSVVVFHKAVQNMINSNLKIQNALQDFLTITIVGLILCFVLTVMILVAFNKINQLKLEILSTFLETTERQLVSYLKKTENFLIILHVDEQVEQNQLVDEEMKNKQGAGFFGKKKRFKNVNFPRTPLAILFLFFFFAAGLFTHFTLLRFTFGNYIEYFGVVANYSSIFSRGQSLIYQNLLANINSTSPVYDAQLSTQINTQFLDYERLFFNWHYRTYSAIKSYNKQFTSILTKNLCLDLNLLNTCYNETMHQNGTLLLVSDLIVENNMIDYSKPLSRKHFLSLEAIKRSHEYLLNQITQVTLDFFSEVRVVTVYYLVAWILTIVVVGILLFLYFEMVIKKDFKLVHCMLKFFPLSFAKQSEGIHNIIAAILGQKLK